MLAMIHYDCIQRSAFSINADACHSSATIAFSVQRLAFSVQHSAFSLLNRYSQSHLYLLAMPFIAVVNIINIPQAQGVTAIEPHLRYMQG